MPKRFLSISFLACNNATSQFQTAVNSCWNLILSSTAFPADSCSCWTSSQLSQYVVTVETNPCLKGFPFLFLACNHATSQFQTAVNSCWNLTLSSTAAPADSCSCWTSSQLTQYIATVKTCDCKYFQFCIPTINYSPPKCPFCLLVSAYANSMTIQSQSCLSAYGTCRKYQDDASAAISACDQSPTGLASKLKSLTANQNAVNQAQVVIGQLKTRQQLLNFRLQSQYKCSDVVVLTSAMVDALNENPASLLVGQLAESIVNASAVVCSVHQ